MSYIFRSIKSNSTLRSEKKGPHSVLYSDGRIPIQRQRRILLESSLKIQKYVRMRPVHLWHMLVTMILSRLIVLLRPMDHQRRNSKHLYRVVHMYKVLCYQLVLIVAARDDYDNIYSTSFSQSSIASIRGLAKRNCSGNQNICRKYNTLNLW